MFHVAPKTCLQAFGVTWKHQQPAAYLKPAGIGLPETQIARELPVLERADSNQIGCTCKPTKLP
jgi:hypothetical protein